MKIGAEREAGEKMTERVNPEGCGPPQPNVSEAAAACGFREVSSRVFNNKEEVTHICACMRVLACSCGGV